MNNHINNFPIYIPKKYKSWSLCSNNNTTTTTTHSKCTRYKLTILEHDFKGNVKHVLKSAHTEISGTLVLSGSYSQSRQKQRKLKRKRKKVSLLGFLLASHQNVLQLEHQSLTYRRMHQVNTGYFQKKKKWKQIRGGNPLSHCLAIFFTMCHGDII